MNLSKGVLYKWGITQWMFVFCWFPVFFYAIDNAKLVSLTLYSTVILCIGSFLEIMWIKKGKVNKDLVLIVTIFEIITFMVLSKIGTLNFRIIRNYLYFGILIILLFCINIYKLKKRDILLVSRIVLILSWIFAFEALFPSSYDLRDYSLNMYLHFQNPNILGNILLIIFVYLYIGYMYEKKNRYIISMGMVIILLEKTHCRTAFLLLILFIISCLLSKIYWVKNRYALKIGMGFGIVFPMLCGIFAGKSDSYFNHIRFFGKSGLAGREVIWKDVMEILLRNKKILVTGYDLSNVEYESIGNNCHNAWMQCIWNVGLILFFLFIIYLYITAMRAVSNIKERSSFNIYVSFLLLMVNNTFETNIVDGIIGMSVMSFGLLWILISNGSIERLNMNNMIRGHNK